MTDEEYRELVRQDKPYFGNHMYFLKYSSSTNSRKMSIWLRLMGLIETWDSTRHRKTHD